MPFIKKYWIFLIAVFFIGAVKYSADRLYYDINNKLIYMGGNALIDDGNVAIVADSIEIFLDNEIIKAVGNFIMKTGKDNIDGDEMLYSFKTKQGIIKNSKGKLEKGILYANEIRKVGEDVFVGIDGKFTTCDHDPPHYYFYSKYLKLYTDNVMFAAPVVLFIGKMPIAAIPYWIFPMRKERHSGFLTPKIGINSIYGKYVRNIGYFYALGKSSGISLYWGIMQYKGWETNGKWEYASNKWAKTTGNGEFHLIREWGNDYRWSINASHYSKRNNISFRWGGNLQSDGSVDADYQENQDAVVLLLKKNALINLEYTPKLYRFSALYNYNYDPYSNSTSYKEPQLSFYLKPIHIVKNVPLIFNDGIYLSSQSYLEKYRIEDTATIYNKVSVKTSANINARGGFFPYINWGGSFVAGYNADSDTVFTSSKTVSLGSNAGTNFAGYMLFPIIGYNIRDVMSLTFNYSVNVDMDKDSLYPSYSLSFNHRFETKKNNKKKTAFTAYVKTNSTYPDTTFMNIFNFGAHTSFKHLSLSGTAQYDYALRQFNKWDFNISSSYGKKGYLLNMAYHISGLTDTTTIHSLSFNANMPLSSRWKGNFNILWNINAQEIIQKTVTITGDLHCWEMGLRWSSSEVTDIYSAYIRIKKLPDIKIERKEF